MGAWFCKGRWTKAEGQSGGWELGFLNGDPEVFQRGKSSTTMGEDDGKRCSSTMIERDDGQRKSLAKTCFKGE